MNFTCLQVRQQLWVALEWVHYDFFSLYITGSVAVTGTIRMGTLCIFTCILQVQEQLRVALEWVHYEFYLHITGSGMVTGCIRMGTLCVLLVFYRFGSGYG